ncbi:MAG TPA: glutamine synthetase family protein [candidate division Zixibacteria bacterium]|nr:glutamine synthetase family protein [candidate division Zixibacteria bacterium]
MTTVVTETGGVIPETVRKAKRTKEEILAQIDQAGAKYVRIFFTDILGRMKGMSMTRSEMEDVLDQGQGFDGSSIEGFVRIEESDLMAIPDFRTFRILPWDVSGERVAMMIADIEKPDGTPYEGDPRYIMRRTVEKLEEKGWTAYLGPELEYFYFSSDKDPATLDSDGYFDFGPDDPGTQVRKRTVKALEAMHIPVECSHHEVAPSQHEIDLKYQEAMVMADFTQLYKYTVKEISRQGGIYATFMPKPLFGENGSGMHTHMSLFEGNRNLFFEEKGEYHLSALARHFIAGVLKHIREITLVTNQWVNSYKRLVPGYEAPVYVSWGRRNRSSLIRVPMYRVGKEKATRIELRSPDPACNPYLSFALMLEAGLDGIENKLPLGGPIEENIFGMSPERRRELKIDALPGSLEAAIVEFEHSDFCRKALGDHVFEKLIENKRYEWDQYRTHVSAFEADKYLKML